MRQKKGVVTSTKMTGTAVVTVDSLKFHPKYKKRYKNSKKFMVDPAGHELTDGDEVLIGECRPLSKNKCFKVIEITKKVASVGEVKVEADVEKAMVREKVAPPVVEEKADKKSDADSDAENKSSEPESEPETDTPTKES